MLWPGSGARDDGRPMMRVAFIDPGAMSYTPATPEAAPLGGSQSALCHLAAQLARDGLDVTVATATDRPGRVHGVRVLSTRALSLADLSGVAAVVVLNGTDAALLAQLRARLGASVRLILWTQHAADEPAMRGLHDPAQRAGWDAFAFVSDWQRHAYLTRFGLPPERCRTLRNAVAPAFAARPPSEQDLAARPWPPILAYTSTPYRGLDVLLDSLPRIRAALPGTVLRVYASLAPYQVTGEADPYQNLYARCRATEGVDYRGAIPQAALAEDLRDVTALAYLNRFPETSCIAVMEALAAGCLVVTSRLGALPETGMGLAHLTPVPDEPAAHAALYAERMVAVLARRRDDPAGTARRLREQAERVLATAIWPVRAAAWAAWFRALAGAAPGAPADRGDPDHGGRRAARRVVADPAEAEALLALARADLSAARWAAGARGLRRAASLGARIDRDLAPLGPAIAEGVDGTSLPARADALERINGIAGLAGAADLARALMREAARLGDHDTVVRAGRVLLRHRPGEAGPHLAVAWAQSALGRHGDALAQLDRALALGSADLLAESRTRALAAGCVAAAETDLARTGLGETAAAGGVSDRAEAVGRLRRLAGLVGALGEDPGLLAETAEAVSEAADPGTAASLLAGGLGRRRLRLGQPAAALPLLRRAGAAGGAAVAEARVAAGLAQAQFQMLDALEGLLQAGQRGEAGPGWRAEAARLIATVDGMLDLDRTPEDIRSRVWGTLRGFSAWLSLTAEPHRPGPVPPGGRRVHDCFPFNDELDMLELRLAEMGPAVDRIVLVEARHTHAGRPKPLHFAENRARFAAYADRIAHVVVEDDPGGFAWRREAHQREAIAHGLAGADPDDLVLVSDVDEILRPEVVAALRTAPGELFAPQLAMRLYFLDLAAAEPWLSVAAAPWSLIRRIGPNHARYLVKQGLGRPVAEAGWHFTWMGGMERFEAKMRAYAHREMAAGFDREAAANRARLARFYADGRPSAGPVPGMWRDLARVPVDARFPASVLADLDRYRRRGWLCPQEAAS
ncbi:glycosyltransferase [Methylobacterium sp. ID0610]|uniref:glycosyltransferase n=1 Tax=Methylobacterium carpenticola TaxID=3344827 RepID=UPI0036CC10DC